LDVVVETLQRSLMVTDECGLPCITVTFDLAIAKAALQIQATETPKYDHLFICFGTFHTICIMAYFKALGYFLDGLGGPEVLTERGILAPGSIYRFLKGKQFNRCSRLHQILMASFQTLHVGQFLMEDGIQTEQLIKTMATLTDNSSSDARTTVEKSPEYDDIMSRYERFEQLTLKDEHGCTAKFCLANLCVNGIYLPAFQ
jgi:hypothetical protein